jgi:hypothetical protein
MSDSNDRERWEQLRRQIIELRLKATDAYVDIGKKILEVKTKELWKLGGFKSFAEYAEQEAGLNERQAYHMMEVWHYFGVHLDAPELLDKLRPLGWGKIRRLVKLVDKRNVDEWLRHGKKTTITQFEIDVRKAKEKLEEERARDERDGARKDDGAAKSGKPTTGRVASRGGGSGTVFPEQHGRSKVMQFVFQDEQIDEVERALKHAKTLTGSDKPSHNLSQVCLDYNASRDWSAGTRHNLAEMMAVFEKQLKARIVVLDAKTNEVIYGEENIEAVAKS